ncbi:ATP-binding protein [Pseudomonas sp. PS02288]|uniref:ATP-binding protein n=1 Tax=Pseudomonas sp. PS02288 TaxID=2991443 RepID=UPI00249C068F|nr:ATP-binding protein [Pseudomonas sp. PS02288]
MPNHTSQHCFLQDGGQMGDEVRAHDWAATPLGPISEWPAALRVTVQTVLNSKFPKCLLWGKSLTAIYNDAFRPILGDKPQPLGRSFAEIWSEAWDTLGPIIERALCGEATYIEDYPTPIHRHGYLEHAYFTFCYSPVQDEHGAIVGVIDTVVETTQRFVVERDLHSLAASLESEIALRTADRNRLWQLSTDLILVARLDGIIASINPAWSSLLGWEEKQLVGNYLLDLVHGDDLGDWKNAVAALREGTPMKRFESRLRHRDGSYRWINWTAVPGDGLINAVGRDFTAEKLQAQALQHTEELLRHSQKMEAVGQLTGGLAHDFNNLLGGIAGSLEMLETRVQQGRIDELGRYIAAGKNATQRAAALTHRLLAFSRRQTLDPRPTDINGLVSGMEELIRRTMGPKIQVEVVSNETLWTAFADTNQLENSLLNFCINARDAMPDGGTLTIETNNHSLDLGEAGERGLAPGEYVSLCVIDTGSGMAAEVIERAFDPFFTTKPTGQGTGLGLSMVYGFARQSGGQVRIVSEPGQGTTLCLYLPRHHGQPEKIEEPAYARPTQARQSEAILVIDDEPILRMLIVEILQEQGYCVLEAEDGPSGLAVIQSGAPIDLLITDVGLPGGLNGRQVADAARQQRPDLKVLFITGYAENAVIVSGQLDPGMQVLTKPFAMDAFVERISHFLKEPSH